MPWFLQRFLTGSRRLCTAGLTGKFALLAALLTSCSPALGEQAGFPRTVADALHRNVTIAHRPERVIAVFPSNVELLWALGAGPRVVAIGGPVFWPAEATKIPRIGGPTGFSPESAASFKPDLVVVTPSSQTALSLVQPFTRSGVPVIVLQHPDIESIFGNIAILGAATGLEKEATALASKLRAKLESIATRVAHRPRPRVYLETGLAARGHYMTVGAGHYADDALRLAGAENVFHHLNGAVQVSGEAVLIANPDVIIQLSRTPENPERISERQGWLGIKALSTGRVYTLARAHTLIPGARQIENVESYARLLHPEVFCNSQ